MTVYRILLPSVRPGVRKHGQGSPARNAVAVAVESVCDAIIDCVGVVSLLFRSIDSFDVSSGTVVGDSVDDVIID